MTRLIFACCIVLLVTGCSRSTPTYELVIGDKTITLPVHKDPKRIQDDILANIKPLWEKLGTGSSVAFQYKRVFPLDFGPTRKELEQKARAKCGDGATVTSTRTASSALVRFYKNREGVSGLEEVEENKGKKPSIFSGNITDWSSVEQLLRGVISIQSVRLIILDEMTP